jgi:23S rRNA (cytosine1962-C5)-methyltransferase
MACRKQALEQEPQLISISASIVDNLSVTFARREQSGQLQHTDALRMFHGPGEAQVKDSALQAVLKNLSVDRFGQHAWVTLWEDGLREEQASSTILQMFEQQLCAPLCEFLQQHFASAVLLYRPLKGVPENPSVLFGAPPAERFTVHEGKAQYLIQLLDAKHPGLFLDHAPLREWLMRNSQGLRVLNTFAYTGSLSVAAGIGGAAHVTTLDLSKATMRWAEANGQLNGLHGERARWIAGDVFEWLPRLKKHALYDMVIMDPPSFSRSDKGTFSTAKDLPQLHALALDLLAPDGLLVTSINSAKVSWEQFEKDILQAAKKCGCKLQVLQRLEQPETFPNWLHEQASERYLKGYIFRVQKN